MNQHTPDIQVQTREVGQGHLDIEKGKNRSKTGR